MLNPAGCVKLKSKSGRFPHPSIYVPECLDCLCVLSSTMPQPLKFFCAADHCGKGLLRPVRVFGGCEHPRLVAYCARAHGPGLDAPALCCSMMQSTWRNLIKTRRCALPSTCRIRMLLSH